MSVFLGSIKKDYYHVIDKNGDYFTIPNMRSGPKFTDNPEFAYTYSKEDALNILDVLEDYPDFKENAPFKLHKMK